MEPVDFLICYVKSSTLSNEQKKSALFALGRQMGVPTFIAHSIE